MIKGKIHSIESMGLVDGPGIRIVIFFQGCNLRCAYCHNPDTWNLNGGKEVTAEELFKRVIRYKSYFQRSGGGITCSGGEPLIQGEFLLEFLKLCKENGIHTALDTAGVAKGNHEDILKYVDLVILDIKHHNEKEYKYITGKDIKYFYDFLQKLNKSNVEVWCRQVIVPGINDDEESIEGLSKFIKKIKDVKKVELLPYHNLGVNKYKELALNYKLKHVPCMDKDLCRKLEYLIHI